MARLCADMRQKTAASDTARPDSARSVLGDPCAAAMAYALCDEEDDAAALLIADLLAAGLSVEQVCLDHLAPAARRLGDMWDRDRLPFTDVTLAAARIQALMRKMPACRTTASCASGKGAIFAAVPGEQHTLGVVMAADLFRRNGWDVGLMVGLTHDELLARMSRDDRPVIGLSCSGDHSYPALRRLLAALGRARPDARLLLAGRIVDQADRLTDLPAAVTLIPDIATAEAEMLLIEAARARPGSTGRGPQGRQRASSAA